MPHAPPQCYDAAFLARLPALAATPLAAAEDLEQLKVLEHGHRLRVVTLGGDSGDGGDAEEELLAHGVDEPADVPKMEAALAARRARAAAQRDT
jgi:CMP-2-keto-3-deoxyoctulosonic acid synthetase